MDGQGVVLLEGETTNTSVWLVRGEEVLAEAQAAVGARDTARDGSPQRLEAALRRLVGAVLEEGEALPMPCRPTVVCASATTCSPCTSQTLVLVVSPSRRTTLSLFGMRQKSYFKANCI